MPTVDQITSLHALLVERLVPYADFSVFGPSDYILEKEAKLAGMQLMPDGSYDVKLMVGPASIHERNACFRIYKIACIMLDIYSEATLDRYSDDINHFARQYGQMCWPTI